MALNRDLTQGSIPKGLLAFALPLILGNLLQQLYNLADTWVVGQVLGEGALAAVGSSYTLMTFLTSILLGLCMGSSVFFAMQFGRKDPARFRAGIFQSFCLIGGLTVVLTGLVYLALGGILWFLRIPADVWDLTRTYLVWVFAGIPATFLYNYFANLLRAIGNSVTPLLLLGVSWGTSAWTCSSSSPCKWASWARRWRRCWPSTPPGWAWPCGPGKAARTCGWARPTGGGTGIFCGSFGASRSSPACNSR